MLSDVICNAELENHFSGTVAVLGALLCWVVFVLPPAEDFSDNGLLLVVSICTPSPEAAGGAALSSLSANGISPGNPSADKLDNTVRRCTHLAQPRNVGQRFN